MEELAFDSAAVVRLPDGPGAVGAYGGAGCIDEGGFRCLKNPLRSRGGLLTGVDLDALAGDDEDGMLRGWRGGGVLGMHSGRKGEGRDEDRIEKAALHCRIVYAFKFEGTKRSVAEAGDVGGYWNDND